MNLFFEAKTRAGASQWTYKNYRNKSLVFFWYFASFRIPIGVLPFSGLADP
jgi:hypothetical protein